ncbi:MAG TPA: DUF1559 domain-containing protein [Pirellulales bacterium]|jgi:prepilin-type processing-associated H-X9-DG protein
MSLLVGLLLPAINSSREAARRIDCSHRLHQIGLALHAHHEARGALPPGWTLEPTGQSAFGWFVPLLPFSEAGALAHSLDMTAPLTSNVNITPGRTALSLSICPSDVHEPLFALYKEVGTHAISGQRSDQVLVWLASANFVAMFGTRDPDDVAGTTGNGAFIETRAFRFTELERGLSETFLIGERTEAQCPTTWVGFEVAGEDAASRVAGLAWDGPNRADADESEFSSRHPGCTNFLWADGHVTPIPDEIDQMTYRQLSKRGFARD